MTEEISNPQDDDDLLGSLGVVDQPSLTKEQAMQALTEVVGTWDSSIDDDELNQLRNEHFDAVFAKY